MLNTPIQTNCFQVKQNQAQRSSFLASVLTPEGRPITKQHVLNNLRRPADTGTSSKMWIEMLFESGQSSVSHMFLHQIREAEVYQ